MKLSDKLGNLIEVAKKNIGQPAASEQMAAEQPEPAQPPEPTQPPVGEEDLGGEDAVSPFSAAGRVAAARASLKRLREQ